jgi:multisubunit Na+/H+ antiporter MnhB subunit
VRERMKDRVTWSLVASLMVLVLAEALFFPWHHMPGYSAAIGLIFAVVIVLLSKALGAWFLQRPDVDG